VIEFQINSLTLFNYYLRYNKSIKLFQVSKRVDISLNNDLKNKKTNKFYQAWVVPKPGFSQAQIGETWPGRFSWPFNITTKFHSDERYSQF
jgi:hypothetical protein